MDKDGNFIEKWRFTNHKKEWRNVFKWADLGELEEVKI